MWPSGVLGTRPKTVELLAYDSCVTLATMLALDILWRHSFSQSTSAQSALGALRYTNLRFTYLLTYLQKPGRPKSNRIPVKYLRVTSKWFQALTVTRLLLHQQRIYKPSVNLGFHRKGLSTDDLVHINRILVSMRVLCHWVEPPVYLGQC